MIPLTVSRFPMSKAGGPEGIAYGVHAHTTWTEFSKPFIQRRQGQKDGPCFAPATFTVEPDGRVRRLKANVTARTLIALDIEASKKTGELPPAIGEVVDHLARWGKAAVIYTSHNHRPDVDKRYRVILPLSEPIDPMLPAVEVVTDHLGLLGVLDTSKIGAASLFYLPSTDPGRLDGHEAYILPGAPLDAARLTAAATRLQAIRDAERERLAAEAHAQAEARRAERLAAGLDPDDSLIEKLRAHYDLADVLRQHGYDQAGKKYRHPNSSSGQYGADIKVLAGVERVFSHNATDPLHADNLPEWCGVTALDAFDVVVILDFGGDRKRALRELPEKFGLAKTAERRAVACLIFDLIRRRATQQAIEAAALAEGNRLGLTAAEVCDVARWVVNQKAAA